MEKVCGGQAAERLEKRGCFPQEEVRRYLTQIVDAVTYLHDRGIVHRDLKLENLLMTDTGDNASVKISDFGLSGLIDGTGVAGGVATEGRRLKERCGTPAYFAPEIVQAVGYGKSVDWWAVGVCAYYMLSNSPPFKAKTTDALFERILEGITPASFTAPCWADVSPSAKDLIAKLLIQEPVERYGPPYS